MREIAEQNLTQSKAAIEGFLMITRESGRWHGPTIICYLQEFHAVRRRNALKYV
jgi:hypothetical protein